MIYERFTPLPHLRCTCGQMVVLPEKLRRLFVETPTITDYVQLEELTGYKALFPEMPSHKLIWLCPRCWQETKEQVGQLSQKLGGLYDFSLTQLSGIKIELVGQSFIDEVENARRRFVDGTDKWRGDKCKECGYRHSKLEPRCPRCSYQEKPKKEVIENYSI